VRVGKILVTLVFVGFIARTLMKIAVGRGLETYITVDGLETTPVEVALTLASILIVVLVARIIEQRQDKRKTRESTHEPGESQDPDAQS
jgi:hypothetical protein